MSSNGDNHAESGVVAASEAPNSRITTPEAEAEGEDGMKRAAAKQFIEQYYNQLTDGCGSDHCDNECCASSPDFKYKNSNKNELAVHAVKLLTVRGKLCCKQRSKVARLCEEKPGFPVPVSDETDSGQTPSTSAVTSRSSTFPSPPPAKEIKFLNEEKLLEIIAQCKIENDWSRLRRIIGSVYNNPDSLMLSFRKKDDPSLPKEYRRAMEEDVDKDTDEKECPTDRPPDNDEQARKLTTDRPPDNDEQRGKLDKDSDDNQAEKCISDRSPNDDEQRGKLEEDSDDNQAEKCIFDRSPDDDDDDDDDDECEDKVIDCTTDEIADKDKVEESLSERTVDITKNSEEEEKEIDTKEESTDNDSGEQLPIQESGSADCVVDEFPSVDEVTVDIPSLRRAYSALTEIPDHHFQGSLINALLYLARTLDMDLRYQKPLEQDPNYINIFIIVMEIPLLQFPEFIEGAFPEFCKAVGHLPVEAQAKLARVWSTYGAPRLKEMVQSLQQLITVKIINGEGRWGRGGYSMNDDDGITGATKVMKILYYTSLYGGKCDPPELLAEEKEINETDDSLQELLQGAVGHEPKELRTPKEDSLGKELGVSALDCRGPLIPFEDFVNEPLNEYVDIETDYKYKIESKFSFVNYSFILTTASKHMSMYFDNRIRMLNERRTSILQTLVHGLPQMPFLRLRVRRDHLIDDALVALEMIAMDNPQDLKKQLFVEFEGEQGLDEGGVSKEFFQLVVEEIFNPDFGMFTYNEVTRHFWFNPTSFENDAQFTLIGIMLGLAIYNSTIVDVHFPMVVYRKLTGKKGTFEDLDDVDPTLASSLKQLLEYDSDDLEDVFMMTFQISYKDVFGSILEHDLKDKGSQISVTQENKEEFVNLYADFLLNKSIGKQFRAFKRGFHMVTNESPLRGLFRPDEIELLVCGSPNFDFHALEEATEYDGGYTSTSQTIRNFWTIVHGFSEEQQRKLLQFTTGTDRVPVGGLSKLKLIIARNGPDSDRLPTSHTCFNVLLLPDYVSRDKLCDRLLKAINYSKGFGML